MELRLHHSVLAGAEKRLLVSVARRLPPWITSDRLTVLAFACMALAGVSFAAFRFAPLAGLAVVVSLAGNWFGDSLDGTLARVRRCERPRYGFYVDHVVDVAGATLLLAGIGVSGIMHPALAVPLLVAYLLVSAEIYLATCVSNVFRMSFLGFGPTELRIVLAAGAIKVMAGGPFVMVPLLGRQRLFDLGGSVAIAGLLLAFGTAVVRQLRALRAAESLPGTSRVAV